MNKRYGSPSKRRSRTTNAALPQEMDMADIWVVLIHDETRRKDKRRTCGHRHASESEVRWCRDLVLENEPNANVYICNVEDAGPFLAKATT